MQFQICFSAASIAVLLLAVGCSEEHTSVEGPRLPIKEIHYDFETSERLGENIFTHDSEGRILKEYYSDLSSNQGDKEILYTYDPDGNLISKKERSPNIDPVFFEWVFTYENGLLSSEASVINDKPVGHQTLYYRSGALIDSAQIFAYLQGENRYQYLTTTVYHYDNQNRLVSLSSRDQMPHTIYRYAGNSLVEVCGIYNEGELCSKNQYSAEGLLETVIETSPWSDDQLNEERFYKNGLLIEKRIYTYPAYEPGNTIDIRSITYEY